MMHSLKIAKCYDNIIKIILLLFALVFIITRAPSLMIEPRFWAEEATHYYQFALSHSFLKSLVYIASPAVPYLYLAASIPVSFATLFPMQYAPYITTFFSLFVMMIPIYLIVDSKSELWPSWNNKLLTITILLAGPAITGEIWLTTTNSQIFCGLCTLIITLEDKENISRKKFWLLMTLQFFISLSGPYSIFLLPIHLFILMKINNTRDIIHSRLVVVCGVIQVTVFLASLLFNKVSRINFWFDYSIYNVINKFIIESFTGGIHDLTLNLLVFSLFLMIVLFSLGSRAMKILIWSLILFMILIPVFSFKHSLDGRYAVLPAMTAYLIVTQGIRHSRQVVKTFSLLLFTYATVIGLARYFPNDESWYCPKSCPNWNEELQKWRDDPEYRPRVWPGKRSIDLEEWSIPLLR